MADEDRVDFFSERIEDALDAIGSFSPGFVHSREPGSLPSWFAVSDLGVASMGAAFAEASALIQASHEPGFVEIDRRLASFWLQSSIRPIGWSLPPVWDSIAGVYETRDGWIRLHTNAPYHRVAALDVLGPAEDAAAVARATRGWTGRTLETAIVESGGCAAEMRSLEEWAEHPQGRAVHAEPLVHWDAAPGSGSLLPEAQQGLAGIRVLDLTRVLAGPVCTRLLAAFGADVLRIDPPGWSEPHIVPEITPGKRCATLDLRERADRGRFEQLMADADVFVHGLRPGALDSLGLGPEERRAIQPDLIDVTLSAYGWSGPWRERRGFDSLVQMSVGIADAGMRRSGSGWPTPLPAQALDHATGYLMAASVLRALRARRETGRVGSARLSLTRTASLLAQTLRETLPRGLDPEREEDLAPGIERTDWGVARRLAFPGRIEGLQPKWTIPAHALHCDAAEWPPRRPADGR